MKLFIYMVNRVANLTWIESLMHLTPFILFGFSLIGTEGQFAETIKYLVAAYSMILATLFVFFGINDWLEDTNETLKKKLIEQGFDEEDLNNL